MSENNPTNLLINVSSLKKPLIMRELMDIYRYTSNKEYFALFELLGAIRVNGSDTISKDAFTPIKTIEFIPAKIDKLATFQLERDILGDEWFLTIWDRFRNDICFFSQFLRRRS